MNEAGIKDPMMFAVPKLQNKRFASEEQVTHWEKNTLSSLLAVQKQMEKTNHHMDNDLRNMDKFLVKADNLLKKKKELDSKRQVFDDFDESEVPDARSATVDRANAALAEELTENRRDSRVKFRLREAVQQGRGDEEDDDDLENDSPPNLPEDGSLPPSPLASPSRLLSPSAAAAAACDEEIEEDDPPLLYGVLGCQTAGWHMAMVMKHPARLYMATCVW